MSPVEIHNGQVLVDGEPQAPLPAPPEPKPKASDRPEDVEPEEIARRMAASLSLGLDAQLTPMEMVNHLLTLRSPAGHKLVWTRFDVYQAFAIWSRKLEGSQRG